MLAGLALIGLFFWHAAGRGGQALIDVSLLRRRGFGAAAAVNLLLMVALFGSLILIPLYYQQVRHEGAVAIGLLLAPQGLGAALALPLAGRLTDKFGARGVASAGMVLAALGMLAYTQVGPGTSYLYLSAALLVVGAGVGATVVPSMAAAFQALSRAETPRATSALNVIQRLGGAIGTALFAIVLSRQAGAGAGGADALAGAFGTTFWVAAGLIAAAWCLRCCCRGRGVSLTRIHQPLQGLQDGQPDVFRLLEGVGGVDLVDLQADRAPARSRPDHPGQVHGRVGRRGLEHVGQPLVALDAQDPAGYLDIPAVAEVERCSGDPGRVRRQAVEELGGLARVGQGRPDDLGIRAGPRGEGVRGERHAA